MDPRTDDLHRLFHRVLRDLDVPMAMVAECDIAPVVIAQTGFDPNGAQRLLALPEFGVLDRLSDQDRGSFAVDGVRSWARADVDAGSFGWGQLVVADRRRRWFDDEEVRHLQLLTGLAARVLEARRTIDVRHVVVIDEPVVVVNADTGRSPARAAG